MIEYTQTMREYRSKFLDENKPLLIDKGNFSKPFWIYEIRNLVTGKRYIGKTGDLRNRAAAYVRSFMNPGTYKPRPITQALREYGIENFVMYPIAKVGTDEEASILEIALIEKFNTTDPSIGYNVMDTIDTRKRNRPKGISPSIDARIHKGKFMLCIEPKKRMVFVCVGMRIFGDYLGISKDLVKNCAKRPCMCRGWHVYYLNKEDREPLMKAKASRTNTRNVEGARSRKEYLDLYLYVDEFANTYDPGIFEDAGYSIYLLTYNSNPYGPMFAVTDIDAFLGMIRD